MTADGPDEPRDRASRAAVVAMLVAFGVLCAGSVGAAGYFAWWAARNAADRAEEKRLDEQHRPPADGQPK